MLNLANKKELQKENKKLSITDIEKFYKKNSIESLIGLEYERLSLDKHTYKNAPYEKLEKIIKHFCDITYWQLVYDNKTIIGAKDDLGNSISLEPGMQLEISLAPKKDILLIDLELTKITKLLDKIGNIYDVIFLGYGISPFTNVDDIILLNKKRYEIMNSYLPNATCGELSKKMMRQTAGIQVNIDYFNQKDAYNKLKFFNLIMPFICGLYANSPFESNKLTDKKSNRSHIWCYTGKERCNIFYKNLFYGFFAKNNIFKNYISEILNVPMIFIERNDKIIELKGKITFKNFIKEGYKGHKATLDDYILHQSLCFPDVRLKKYIEIRNHDSSNPKMALALCTLYKGLLNNDIEKLLKKFNYLKIENIEKYNKEIILDGLDAKIKNTKSAWDVVIDLFKISKSNLSAHERAYLEPILKILKYKKTQADEIINAKINSIKELKNYFINKY